MVKYLTDIFTSADNKTFSMSKTLVFISGLAMVGEFIYKGSVEYQNFAVGIAAIVASLAIKSYTDQKNADPQ